MRLLAVSFSGVSLCDFLVGIKLVSTPQTRIWLFYALKDAEFIAWTLYAIFSACLITVFCLLFSEDLTALIKYTNCKVKIYCW